MSYYEKLFKEEYSWRPKLDGLNFDSIDESSASWLEREFDDEEILNVVLGIAKDKALGLDEFAMAFFS